MKLQKTLLSKFGKTKPISLPGEKWGLVLAGGGTRGAYEAGVWKAILDLKIDIQGFAGTSIGAINSAMILQDDFDRFYELWTTISFNDILPEIEDIDTHKDIFSPQNLFALAAEYLKEGGLDSSMLRSSLMDFVDVERVYRSPKDLGIVTFDLASMKPMVIFKDEIRKEKLVDYLCASANFPIFKTKNLDGKKFIDGGVYDNMPMNMLVNRGYDHLILVDINTIGAYKSVEYPENVYIKVIRASGDLGGIFDFNKQRIRGNIVLGYLDTMKAFHRLVGNEYFFRLSAFNELMLNFDLETIRGLEIAAKTYEMDRLKIYKASDFLKELYAKHIAAKEKLNEDQKNSFFNIDIANIRIEFEEGTLIPHFQQMIREHPKFMPEHPFAKMFPQSAVAAAAMLELEDYMSVLNITTGQK